MKEPLLEFLETSEPESFFEYNKKADRGQNPDMKRLSQIRYILIRLWKCKSREKYGDFNIL
jgi:hypothetical protein